MRKKYCLANIKIDDAYQPVKIIVSCHKTIKKPSVCRSHMHKTTVSYTNFYELLPVDSIRNKIEFHSVTRKLL